MSENKYSPSAKKDTILIVDDSEMNREMLADMLEDEFDTIQASNGVEAVTILKEKNAEISLVLLDMVMPEMDGFDVLTVMNNYRWIKSIPVIMISVENSGSYIERAYDLGVTDYIRRPFDAIGVRRRVINTITLYANQKRLIGLVADQIYEKEKSNSLMINILSHIVEFRNGESGLHVLHIHTITQALLNRLVAKEPDMNMNEDTISLISMASALHDIGKITIPEEILNKPGRFTPEEFEIMKKHSMMGATMLADLPYHDEPLVKTAYEICRWHHERFDGRGYPDGLKGNEIPLSAQVVSVADVYDALTSERVYKKAFSHEKAMEMILNGECGSFNPIILSALSDIQDFLKDELKNSSEVVQSRREADQVTDKVLKINEMSGSEDMLKALENERIKYRFLSSISNDIQFEYIDDPSMVTFLEKSAASLGLPESIVDPLNNEKMTALFPKELLHKLSELLHQSSPAEPVVKFECELSLNCPPKKYNVICRSMWSSDESENYIGAIGKIIEAH